MNGHKSVMLGKRLCRGTVWLSWVTELFLVGRVSLEMAGHLAMTVGRDFTVTSGSYHCHEMYVFCVQLCKISALRGQPYDYTRNGLERKKIIYVSCNGLKVIFYM